MVATLMTAPNAGSNLDTKGRNSLAHTIVVGNEKGGAGKSTLAIHIVCGLLHAGRRVAIIDLDLRQRSMSTASNSTLVSSQASDFLQILENPLIDMGVCGYIYIPSPPTVDKKVDLRPGQGE